MYINMECMTRYANWCRAWLVSNRVCDYVRKSTQLVWLAWEHEECWVRLFLPCFIHFLLEINSLKCFILDIILQCPTQSTNSIQNTQICVVLYAICNAIYSIYWFRTKKKRKKKKKKKLYCWNQNLTYHGTSCLYICDRSQSSIVLLHTRWLSHRQPLNIHGSCLGKLQWNTHALSYYLLRQAKGKNCRI